VTDFLGTQFRFGGASTITVADTSTPTQVASTAAGARLITLAGTLTAARTIVLVTQPGWDWTIWNTTAQTVTVAAQSGGTTVPVQSGAILSVIATSAGIALPTIASNRTVAAVSGAAYSIAGQYEDVTVENGVSSTITLRDASVAVVGEWHLIKSAAGASTAEVQLISVSGDIDGNSGISLGLHTTAAAFVQYYGGGSWGVISTSNSTLPFSPSNAGALAGDSLTATSFVAVQTDDAAAFLSLGATAPCTWKRYGGSPESHVAANPGSLCSDYTNGELYIKKTGTGNTGWKLVTHA